MSATAGLLVTVLPAIAVAHNQPQSVAQSTTNPNTSNCDYHNTHGSYNTELTCRISPSSSQQNLETDSGKGSCSPALLDSSFDSGIVVVGKGTSQVGAGMVDKQMGATIAAESANNERNGVKTAITSSAVTGTVIGTGISCNAEEQMRRKLRYERLQQWRAILLELDRQRDPYRRLRERLSKICERRTLKKGSTNENICNVCCCQIDQFDSKSVVTCCVCNKKICRGAKCSSWLPKAGRWECQLCQSSKESLTHTQSWVAEQMSFNRQKYVYPMRARSEIYIPIGDCNESSMHFESVSQVGENTAAITAEQKFKIREYVEEVVSNLLGGSLDQIRVGQLSRSENYLPSILNKSPSPQPTPTLNGNHCNVNKPSEFSEISQTRLRYMIESIIADTLRMPPLANGSASELALNTHARSNGAIDRLPLENGNLRLRHRPRTDHYFEPKIYQDLLATAVLNKISDKEGNLKQLSESTPDLSSRNIDANFNVENQSTSSGSSIEPRSDFSYTDTERSPKKSKHVAGRESALSDYIAGHTVPLPDLSAAVTESEDDDRVSVSSSTLAEGTWEDNWLFRKKRSSLTTSMTGGMGMLVPAPKDDVRAQIGDKTTDEISDLSEMGSDTDDSSLKLSSGNLDQLNDRILNKHLIGGQNTKVVLDELIETASLISNTSRATNEPEYHETRNDHVVGITAKTEAINNHTVKLTAEDQGPLSAPTQSDDEIIEEISCTGYSVDDMFEEMPSCGTTNSTCQGPSVIEILAALALRPMLAVPTSEQSSLLTSTEMASMKELSDIALAEIKIRGPQLGQYSLDIIDEEEESNIANATENDENENYSRSFETPVAGGAEKEIISAGKCAIVEDVEPSKSMQVNALENLADPDQEVKSKKEIEKGGKIEASRNEETAVASETNNESKLEETPPAEAALALEPAVVAKTERIEVTLVDDQKLTNEVNAKLKTPASTEVIINESSTHPETNETKTQPEVLIIETQIELTEELMLKIEEKLTFEPVEVAKTERIEVPFVDYQQLIPESSNELEAELKTPASIEVILKEDPAPTETNETENLSNSGCQIQPEVVINVTQRTVTTEEVKSKIEEKLTLEPVEVPRTDKIEVTVVDDQKYKLETANKLGIELETPASIGVALKENPTQTDPNDTEGLPNNRTKIQPEVSITKTQSETIEEVTAKIKETLSLEPTEVAKTERIEVTLVGDFLKAELKTPASTEVILKENPTQPENLPNNATKIQPEISVTGTQSELIEEEMSETDNHNEKQAESTYSLTTDSQNESQIATETTIQEEALQELLTQPDEKVIDITPPSSETTPIAESKRNVIEGLPNNRTKIQPEVSITKTQSETIEEVTAKIKETLSLEPTEVAKTERIEVTLVGDFLKAELKTPASTEVILKENPTQPENLPNNATKIQPEISVTGTQSELIEEEMSETDNHNEKQAESTHSLTTDSQNESQIATETTIQEEALQELLTQPDEKVIDITPPSSETTPIAESKRNVIDYEPVLVEVQHPKKSIAEEIPIQTALPTLHNPEKEKAVETESGTSAKVTFELEGVGGNQYPAEVITIETQEGPQENLKKENPIIFSEQGSKETVGDSFEYGKIELEGIVKTLGLGEVASTNASVQVEPRHLEPTGTQEGTQGELKREAIGKSLAQASVVEPQLEPGALYPDAVGQGTVVVTQTTAEVSSTETFVQVNPQIPETIQTQEPTRESFINAELLKASEQDPDCGTQLETGPDTFQSNIIESEGVVETRVPAELGEALAQPSIVEAQSKLDAGILYIVPQDKVLETQSPAKSLITETSVQDNEQHPQAIETHEIAQKILEKKPQAQPDAEPEESTSAIRVTSEPTPATEPTIAAETHISDETGDASACKDSNLINPPPEVDEKPIVIHSRAEIESDREANLPQENESVLLAQTQVPSEPIGESQELHEVEEETFATDTQTSTTDLMANAQTENKTEVTESIKSEEAVLILSKRSAAKYSEEADLKETETQTTVDYPAGPADEVSETHNKAEANSFQSNSAQLPIVLDALSSCVSRDVEEIYRKNEASIEAVKEKRESVVESESLATTVESEVSAQTELQISEDIVTHVSLETLEKEAPESEKIEIELPPNPPQEEVLVSVASTESETKQTGPLDEDAEATDQGKSQTHQTAIDETIVAKTESPESALILEIQSKPTMETLEETFVKLPQDTENRKELETKTPTEENTNVIETKTSGEKLSTEVPIEAKPDILACAETEPGIVTKPRGLTETETIEASKQSGTEISSDFESSLATETPVPETKTEYESVAILAIVTEPQAPTETETKEVPTQSGVQSPQPPDPDVETQMRTDTPALETETEEKSITIPIIDNEVAIVGEVPTSSESNVPYEVVITDGTESIEKHKKSQPSKEEDENITNSQALAEALDTRDDVEAKPLTPPTTETEYSIGENIRASSENEAATLSESKGAATYESENKIDSKTQCGQVRAAATEARIEIQTELVVTEHLGDTTKSTELTLESEEAVLVATLISQATETPVDDKILIEILQRKIASQVEISKPEEETTKLLENQTQFTRPKHTVETTTDIEVEAPIFDPREEAKSLPDVENSTDMEVQAPIADPQAETKYDTGGAQVLVVASIISDKAPVIEPTTQATLQVVDETLDIDLMKKSETHLSKPSTEESATLVDPQAIFEATLTAVHRNTNPDPPEPVGTEVESLVESQVVAEQIFEETIVLTEHDQLQDTDNTQNAASSDIADSKGESDSALPIPIEQIIVETLSSIEEKIEKPPFEPEQINELHLDKTIFGCIVKAQDLDSESMPKDTESPREAGSPDSTEFVAEVPKGKEPHLAQTPGEEKALDFPKEAPMVSVETQVSEESVASEEVINKTEDSMEAPILENQYETKSKTTAPIAGISQQKSSTPRETESPSTNDSIEEKEHVAEAAPLAEEMPVKARNDSEKEPPEDSRISQSPDNGSKLENEDIVEDIPAQPDEKVQKTTDEEEQGKATKIEPLAEEIGNAYPGPAEFKSEETTADEKVVINKAEPGQTTEQDQLDNLQITEDKHLVDAISQTQISEDNETHISDILDEQNFSQPKAKSSSMEALPQNAESSKVAQEITDIETQGTESHNKVDSEPTQPTECKQNGDVTTKVFSEEVVAEPAAQNSSEAPEAVADKRVLNAEPETLDIECTETVQALETEVKIAASHIELSQDADILKEGQPQTIEHSLEKNADITKTQVEAPPAAAQSETKAEPPQYATTEPAHEKEEAHTENLNDLRSNTPHSSRNQPEKSVEKTFEETTLYSEAATPRSVSTNNESEANQASTQIVKEATDKAEPEKHQTTDEETVTATKDDLYQNSSELMTDLGKVSTKDQTKILVVENKKPDETPISIEGVPSETDNKNQPATDGDPQAIPNESSSEDAQTPIKAVTYEDSTIILPNTGNVYQCTNAAFIETPPDEVSSVINVDTIQKYSTHTAPQISPDETVIDKASPEPQIEVKSDILQPVETSQEISIRTEEPVKEGTLKTSQPAVDKQITTLGQTHVTQTQNKPETLDNKTTETVQIFETEAQLEDTNIEDLKDALPIVVLESDSSQEANSTPIPSNEIPTIDQTEIKADQSAESDLAKVELQTLMASINENVTPTEKVKEETASDAESEIKPTIGKIEVDFNSATIINRSIEISKHAETELEIAADTPANAEIVAKKVTVMSEPEKQNTTDGEIVVTETIQELAVATNESNDELPNDQSRPANEVSTETLEKIVESQILIGGGAISATQTLYDDPQGLPVEAINESAQDRTIPLILELSSEILPILAQDLGKSDEDKNVLALAIEEACTSTEPQMPHGLQIVQIIDEQTKPSTESPINETQPELQSDISQPTGTDPEKAIEAPSLSVSEASEVIDNKTTNGDNAIITETGQVIAQIGKAPSSDTPKLVESQVTDNAINVKAQDLPENISVSMLPEPQIKEKIVDKFEAPSETENAIEDGKLVDGNTETSIGDPSESKHEHEEQTPQPTEIKLLSDIVEEDHTKVEQDKKLLTEHESVVDDETQDKDAPQEAESATVGEIEALEAKNKYKIQPLQTAEGTQEVLAEIKDCTEEVTLKAESESSTQSSQIVAHEGVVDVKTDVSVEEPRNDTQFEPFPETIEVVDTDMVEVAYTQISAAEAAKEIVPEAFPYTETTQTDITEPSSEEKSYVAQNQDFTVVGEEAKVLQPTESETHIRDNKLVEEVSVQAESAIHKATDDKGLIDIASQTYPDTTQLQNIVVVEALNILPPIEASEDTKNIGEYKTTNAETECTETKIETETEIRRPVASELVEAKALSEESEPTPTYLVEIGGVAEAPSVEALIDASADTSNSTEAYNQCDTNQPFSTSRTDALAEETSKEPNTQDELEKLQSSNDKVEKDLPETLNDSTQVISKEVLIDPNPTASSQQSPEQENEYHIAGTSKDEMSNAIETQTLSTTSATEAHCATVERGEATESLEEAAMLIPQASENQPELPTEEIVDKTSDKSDPIAQNTSEDEVSITSYIQTTENSVAEEMIVNPKQEAVTEIQIPIAETVKETTARTPQGDEVIDTTALTIPEATTTTTELEIREEISVILTSGAMDDEAQDHTAEAFSGAAVDVELEKAQPNEATSTVSQCELQLAKSPIEDEVQVLTEAVPETTYNDVLLQDTKIHYKAELKAEMELSGSECKSELSAPLISSSDPKAIEPSSDEEALQLPNSSIYEETICDTTETIADESLIKTDRKKFPNTLQSKSSEAQIEQPTVDEKTENIKIDNVNQTSADISQVEGLSKMLKNEDLEEDTQIPKEVKSHEAEDIPSLSFEALTKPAPSTKQLNSTKKATWNELQTTAESLVTEFTFNIVSQIPHASLNEEAVNTEKSIPEAQDESPIDTLQHTVSEGVELKGSIMTSIEENTNVIVTEALAEEIVSEDQIEAIPDSGQLVVIDRELSSEIQASTEKEATELHIQSENKVTGAEITEPILKTKIEVKSDITQLDESQITQTALGANLVVTTVQVLAETVQVSKERHSLETAEDEKYNADEGQALIGIQSTAPETETPHELLFSEAQAPENHGGNNRDPPGDIESELSVPAVTTTTEGEGAISDTQSELHVDITQPESKEIAVVIVNHTASEALETQNIIECQAATTVPSNETQIETNKLQAIEIQCIVEVDTPCDKLDTEVHNKPAPKVSASVIQVETYGLPAPEIECSLEVAYQTSNEESVQDASVQPQSEVKKDASQQAIVVEAQTSVEAETKETPTQFVIETKQAAVDGETEAGIQSLDKVTIAENECELLITQPGTQSAGETEIHNETKLDTLPISTKATATEASALEEMQILLYADDEKLTEMTPEGLVTETEGKIKSNALQTAKTELSKAVQTPQTEVDNSIIEMETTRGTHIEIENERDIDTTKTANSDQVDVMSESNELAKETLSELLQNAESKIDTKPQTNQTEDKPNEVKTQVLYQAPVIDVEPEVEPETPQSQDLILSDSQITIEATEAPAPSKTPTVKVIKNKTSVDNVAPKAETKPTTTATTDSPTELFPATLEPKNIEDVDEAETQAVNDIKTAIPLTEIIPETSTLTTQLKIEEIITEQLEPESLKASESPPNNIEDSPIMTNIEPDLASESLILEKLVPAVGEISEEDPTNLIREAQLDEVSSTENCEKNQISNATENVKEPAATVESCTDESLDKTAVENVAFTKPAAAITPKDISSDDNSASANASGMVFIEPLRNFIRPMTKRLCRQSHVVDTTSSDEGYSQRSVSHLTTMCRHFIKDKRLLAALDKQRRQTEIMQNFLRSIDSFETEFDYEQHSQCLLPEQTFILSTPPPPPPDDSTNEVTDSYLLSKALSDCQFNFINDILFSDQLSTDSNHTDESTPTTVESLLADYNNEQDLSHTNSFPNASINLTNLTNGSYLSLSPSKSFNISTNNNREQNFINNNTKHQEDINSEEDDDVVLLRHFVPGSIAEREYKKWNNAVEMPNNPYTPEALKRRISGSQERFIDLPNINSSTENHPISLVETTKTETESADEIDYKRYSRDYYINDEKTAKMSPKRQAIPNDCSRTSASDEPATDISINESTQEANETQIFEPPIEPHHTLYQALPAHVVEENASIETLSNQSMQSVNTTTSDDSDTVRIYDFKKQQTIIVRNGSKASPAASIESLPADPSEPTLQTNTTISTSIEDSPPNSPRPRRPTDVPLETSSSTSSLATVRTPITPTRGSTPMAFKFLQPKRKLIEPSQILSVEEGADALIISPPVERAVVEEEVAQVMPSVKALAQAFLRSSSTKTTPAEKRWRRGVHSMPPASDNPNTKEEVLRNSKARLSVAEVGDDATFTSDISLPESDSTTSKDHSAIKAPATLSPLSPPSPINSPTPGVAANADGSKSTTNALRRVSMLKSNIAFFENLKFK